METRVRLRPQVTALARDADVIVTNLFGMPPSAHLAEKLDVPLVVCSPSLVPYACPVDFVECFRDELPDLAALLDQGEVCVSWEEITSWLWPLWTHRHGLFREHFLQLSACPFVDARGGEFL